VAKRRQTLRPGRGLAAQRVVAGREECPDAGHAGRRPVRVLCPPCGRPSDRSSGRPVSTRPVPSRCPDGRASGVRGSAAALSAPRWPLEWLGAAGRPRWAQWVRRAAVVRGGVVARPRTGLTGRDGAALAVGGSHEGRLTWAAASHAHRLRRRPAALPTREPSSARVPIGWLGSTRTSMCSPVPPQMRPGQVAGVARLGAGQGAVTTLRGLGAGDGPVSSVPEGPSGSAGQQAAAAARPRT
jgi:hypothetical protein